LFKNNGTVEVKNYPFPITTRGGSVGYVKSGEDGSILDTFSITEPYYDSAGPHFRKKKGETDSLIIYDAPGAVGDMQKGLNELSRNGKDFDKVLYSFDTYLLFAGIPQYKVHWERVIDLKNKQWVPQYTNIKGMKYAAGKGETGITISGDCRVPKSIREMTKGKTLSGGVYRDKELTKLFPAIINPITSTAR
jgi:hypothetical protein